MLATWMRNWEQMGSTRIQFEVFEHEVEQLVPSVEQQITGQGIDIVEEGFTGG